MPFGYASFAQDNFEQTLQTYYPASMLELLPWISQNIEKHELSPIQVKTPTKAPLRVALDPGHLGGKYSGIEDRLIHFVNDSNPSLSEGDIALDIARNLEQKLKDLKVQVLLTRREPGVSAMGKSFDQWKNNESQVRIDIERVGKLYTSSDKSDAAIAYWWNLYQSVKNIIFEHLEAGSKEYLNYKKLFNQVYLVLDREQRSRIINNFSPHVTFIIHLNTDGPIDSKTGLHQGHEKNFHTGFIAGGIARDELTASANNSALFFQLQNSQWLKTSSKICRVFVDSLVELTGVRKIDISKDYNPQKNEATYLDSERSVSLFDENHFPTGVFARNLSLTRGIHGPLCFGESFLLDNLEFARKMQNIVYYNKTVEQISEAYLRAFQSEFDIK